MSRKEVSEWFALLKREQTLTDGTFRARLKIECDIKSNEPVCLLPHKHARLLEYVAGLERRLSKIERATKGRT